MLNPNKKINFILNKKQQQKFVNVGVLHELEKQNDYVTLHKILDCGERLLIKQRDDGLVNVESWYCNQHKLCAICSNRRAYKYKQNLSNKINYLNVESLHQNHFVFKMKNTKQMESGFNKIASAKSKLLDMIRKTKKSEVYKIVGFIGSIEITKNDLGEYHYHMHLLTFSHERLDNRRLLQDWHDCGGSSIDYPIIDSNTDHLKNLIGYIAKLPKLSPVDLVKYKSVTYRRPLLFTGGIFRGLKLPDKLSNELNGMDFVFHYYQWCNRTNQYIEL